MGIFSFDIERRRQVALLDFGNQVGGCDVALVSMFGNTEYPVEQGIVPPGFVMDCTGNDIAIAVNVAVNDGWNREIGCGQVFVRSKLLLL